MTTENTVKKSLTSFQATIRLEEKLKELGLTRRAISFECMSYPYMSFGLVDGRTIKCNMATHEITVKEN